MKKRIKLFSSALAIGMLLGTGVGAMSCVAQHVPGTTMTAKASEQSARATQVTINENDVEIDQDTGVITYFNNVEKARLLLAGGELVIPETIGEGENKATVTGIADIPDDAEDSDNGVFDKDHLEFLTNTTDASMPGISKLTFAKPENIKFIGAYAFYANQITTLSLPAATEIEGAAFAENALISIKLHQEADVIASAFVDQDILNEVMPSKDGEIQFAALKPTLLKGNDDHIKAVSRVTFYSGESIELDNGVTLQVDNDSKKITGASHPESYPVGLNTTLDTENPLPGDYSISSYSLTVNPFKENPDGGGGLPGNGNSSNETDTNPDNGTDGESGNNNGNETKPQPAPKPEERRPHTVYAKRGMRLHRNVSLTSPIRSYKKQSRAKAPSFRVRGIEYDKNGKKRYKVDGGYITAGASYVADSHFRSNKVRQVRVLSNRVNSYKDVKLSSNKKVRSYKKGTKLRVKRVVNWGRATRFELTNGRYITGNKQLLIMDQK